MPISLFYVGVLSLFFCYLSIAVILCRRKSGVALLTGNNAELEKRVRAHGNFAEYTPIFLLLLFGCEYFLDSSMFIHVMGGIYCIGRLMHAYAIVNERIQFRVIAMGITFTIIIVLACINILQYVW